MNSYPDGLLYQKRNSKISLLNIVKKSKFLALIDEQGNLNT